ncbi:MAG: hypothetical protein PHX27_02255 [Candidatus ainarchaeum sp.]|nr:hypothetical protein [Candidatus ainarchaeum sp.]
MKNNGLFTFIVLLVMLLIITEFSIGLNKSNTLFEKNKNELIKLENAHKERTILEENVDKIIKIKLEEISQTSITNILIAQNEINSVLYNYLKNRAKAKNIFSENETDLTLRFLNENSVVSILKIKEITYAEYVFTSNISKTNIVWTKLGNYLKLEFKIPVDYITRAIT